MGPPNMVRLEPSCPLPLPKCWMEYSNSSQIQATSSGEKSAGKWR